MNEARVRFEREVELTARLEHPNIARVYDGGIDQGRYFYAMELLVGRPLDQYVKEQALSRRQIVELMMRVCGAVRHAHQRGVIHRDLKPSNIVVTDDAQPHVLDFGLAKQAASDAGARPGEIAGTIAYMAPEQALGDSDRVDTRADVYSLGVMLFLLLTGQWPHDNQGTEEQLLNRRANCDARQLRQADPTLDREIDAIVNKALSRDAEQRYASAAELAGDLDHYLAGDPLAARKPTLGYLLGRKLRKYRVETAIGGAALLGLILLGIVAIAQIKHARDRADRQRERVESLMGVSVAMSRQRDIEGLLRTIVTEARRLSGADAGSLFVREGDHLRFRVAQNQTLARQRGQAGVSQDFNSSTVPITTSSMAGFVASTRSTLNIPDVYALDASAPYHHDPKFDQRNGYRTRSLLAVPLTDPDNHVLGVLELINCTDADGTVIPFPPEQVKLMESLGSQAAIALRYAQSLNPKPRPTP
jgi:hypothetical protein